MESRIPQEELNNHLWNAAVLLRTYIDAGSYKQYIFPLLFFKRLSDVYDEETAKVIFERIENHHLARFDEVLAYMKDE